MERNRARPLVNQHEEPGLRLEAAFVQERAEAQPPAYVFLTFFLTSVVDNFWQTLRGPFSAVSTPNFASK